MPGPAPKPTSLRKLQGNPSRRPLPSEEPAPEEGAPDAPEGLDELGRAAWDRMSRALLGMRVLTKVDGVALHLLVDALVEWHLARQVVRSKGATYECKTESGATMYRVRPEVAMAADAWRRAKAMLAEFGLTPSSRTRVAKAGGLGAPAPVGAPAAPPEDDDLDGFLFGRTRAARSA